MAAHELDRMIGGPSPWLMGVLNVTPDSFTDGGRFLRPDDAHARLASLIAEGADIIDIGSESTAPGRAPIDADAEQARLLPILNGLPRSDSVPLSIDTYHASTAKLCLEHGFRIVNDVSAMRADNDMAAVVADHDAILLMMYAKDGPLPHATEQPRSYGDVVREVGDFLAARVDIALARRIPAERLILDPGMGRFVSLEPRHSYELLARFDELALRFAPIPMLVGTSRKGFLGGRLEDRDPVSQLTATVALAKGARLMRTHNIKMAQAFLESWKGMAMPL